MSIFTEILQKYWGYTSFRPLQEDIIASVVNQKKDTLGLLPTGGGKSIIFQVPALCSDGVCIVITPLVALMKDQVENLRKRRISAVAVYTGLSSEEIKNAYDSCVFGRTKFLYISPERIASTLFQERLKQIQVNLIAVDESHCISQWGYDFRPPYLAIGRIRELIPNVPVLALTATATPEVAKDIQDKLRFKEYNVFKKSFYRENLVYIVRKVENKDAYLLKVINNIKGSGVVYVRNRKRTKEIAEFLKANGISADYYHAGLTNAAKDQRQKDWKEDKIRIIVSTNAFGMGIDKPDVRVVVHMDVPDSLEAYFQEAGRGGRDEKEAFAVLLYNNFDIFKLIGQLKNSFPSIEYIKRIYNCIGDFYNIPVMSNKGNSFEFHIGEFIEYYKLDILPTMGAIKILERCGYISLSEETHQPDRVKFLASREDLYKFQVSKKEFDSFVKLLLRNHTGIFGEFCRININNLAFQANTTPYNIYQYLGILSNFKIIEFQKENNAQYITLLEDRLPEKSLNIANEYYNDLLDRQLKRISSVITYCENGNQCRSNQLCRYFGETELTPCNNCDVCKKKVKEKEIDAIVFTHAVNHILSNLLKNNNSLEDILKNCPIDLEFLQSILDMLVENNIISISENGEVNLLF